MNGGIEAMTELPGEGAVPDSFASTDTIRLINPHSTVRLRLHTKMERAIVGARLPNCRFQRYGSAEPKLLLKGATDPSAESQIDLSIVYALLESFPNERIHVFCDTPSLKSREDLNKMSEEEGRVYLDRLGMVKEYDDMTRQFFTSRMLLSKLPEEGLVYFITRARDVGSSSLLVNSLDTLGYSFVTLCRNQERDEVYEVQMFNPARLLGKHGSVMLERRERTGQN